MSDMEEEGESSMQGKDSPEQSPQASKKRKDWSPDDRKHAKSKRVKGIDDEAAQSDEESSEGGSSDGESEEDDTQYVEDGFLVRDDADSDSDSAASENENDEEDVKKKKQLQRLKKRKEDFRLDEEDEQLIREYQASKAGTSARDELLSREGEVDGDNEIIPEVRKRSGSGNSNGNAESDAEAEMRGDGAHGRDAHREKQHAYYDDDDEGSDMGGFIVDEDEEREGSQDEGVRRRNRSGSGGVEGQRVAPHRRTGRREGPTYDQLQEAMDIFGAGFDDFSDEEEENLGSGSGDENEDGEGERATSGRDWDVSAGNVEGLNKKTQKSIGKLRSRYERSVIVSTFSTERDDELRRVDRPERMQMALVGRETPQDEERQLEAQWMAKKLAARMIADGHLDSTRASVYSTANPVAAFSSPLYSMSDYAKEEALTKELVEPICQVLRFMQVMFQ